MIIRRVEGTSMSPSIVAGSMVVGIKKTPNINDIVIARVKNKEVIKRVRSIDNDAVFLVGDNSLESTDSREYGSINKSDILAVVMVTIPKATKAPALKKPYGLWVSLLSAVIIILFALIHLFRIDTFLPELNIAVPGGYDTARILAVAIVTSEVFAVPILLRMRLSPLARFTSGILVILVPLVWLLIAMWNHGLDVSTAQLGEFYSLPSSTFLITTNLLWLALNTFALWTLNFDWPPRLKKKH